jgi:carbon storage regulator
MLVLSRGAGESVQIGDAVVMVLRDDAGRIRLGIDAPRHVNIVRTELLPEDVQLELQRRMLGERQPKKARSA